MKINLTNTVCEIKTTSNFNKQLKKVIRQNRNINELIEVVGKLANLKSLEEKYKNHCLINDRNYKNCFECHIKPDWLLIYKYCDNQLVLILLATGSHSELFNM